jgi:hypothetical protein
MAKITPIEMVSTKPYIKKMPMLLLSVLSQLLYSSNVIFLTKTL